MIVSGLRRTWRSERRCRRGRAWSSGCLLCRSVAVGGSVVRDAGFSCAADEREEDVLEGGLLLDVLNLGGREKLLEFGEGAVPDDRALVQDRYAVGEMH